MNNDPNRFFVECRCSCNMIEFERDADDNDVYVSMWQHGYGSGQLSLKERIRWCWNIAATGRPWVDHVILEPKDASLLAAWLKRTDPMTQMTAFQTSSTPQGLP